MAILGIDEVGRGPWAGPLVVGAVVLPEDFDTTILADSKKLTPKTRKNVCEAIFGATPQNVGLGWVSAQEIDEIGLSETLKLATRRAVEQVKVPFHEIVIDGTVNFLVGTKLERHVSVLPKADGLISAVSAASIVAKVVRDRYMASLDERYPGYGFAKHVGYGTVAHRTALRDLGVCDEHRKSFKPIAEMLGETVEKRLSSGAEAEGLVAEKLKIDGYEVVERNWRTRFCEIDIVAVRDGRVYFVEVKYRRDGSRGGGLVAVNAAKQKQMKRAAEAYIVMRKCELDPVLIVASVSGVPMVVDEVVEVGF